MVEAVVFGLVLVCFLAVEVDEEFVHLRLDVDGDLGVSELVGVRVVGIVCHGWAPCGNRLGFDPQRALCSHPVDEKTGTKNTIRPHRPRWGCEVVSGLKDTACCSEVGFSAWLWGKVGVEVGFGV